MEKKSINNLFLFFSIISLRFLATQSKLVSAIYAFGDSVFDAGNNNNLPTICRANHLPYGIDFPEKIATGRFSNGLLAGDILIADLGIKKLLPAYLDKTVQDADLLTGVTFASACSGLDDLTATEVGALTLSAQFKNFQKAFQTMEAKFGLEKAVAVVEKALFIVSAGNNDMMDNYYALPVRKVYSLSAYHNKLLTNLEDFAKKLQKAGAKRLAVIGLPPLGCLPMDVTNKNFNMSGDLFRRECKSKHNSDAQEYNAKLQAFLKKMKVAMPKFKIAYMDIYTPLIDMINNPKNFGFKSALEGCCGTGSVELGPLCSILTFTCPQRSEYIFFDASHPTQAAYKRLAKMFKQKVLPGLL